MERYVCSSALTNDTKLIFTSELLHQARQEFENRSFFSAFEFFSKVLELNAFNDDAYAYRARCLNALSEFASARTVPALCCLRFLPYQEMHLTENREIRQSRRRREESIED
jgi:hypothetical protein